MKWTQELGPALPREELEEDFRRARDLGKVRLGERCLYFTRLSGTVCLPYGEVVWAYLRQEEVNAKLCCGQANFDQFYLMVQGSDGKLRRGQVLTKQAGGQALEHIAARCPEAKIGYYKNAAG